MKRLGITVVVVCLYKEYGIYSTSYPVCLICKIHTSFAVYCCKESCQNSLRSDN